MKEKLIVLGMHYRHSPVEWREKLFSVLGEIEEELIGGFSKELVTLSTCHRIEFYLVVEENRKPDDLLTAILKRMPEFSKEGFYIYSRREVVAHLFRVVSSLDSMVIGETQILGQVKKAFETAVGNNRAGKILTRLFQKALHTGKRARTETSIGEHAVTMAQSSVQLAKKIFSDLKTCKCMVVGSGEIAELALHAFQRNGVRDIRVTSPTKEHAQALASRFQVQVLPYDKMEGFLPKVQLFIVATASKQVILDLEKMRACFPEGRSEPLFMVDLSFPRNISEDVNKLSWVYLFYLEDLEGLAQENLHLRQAAIKDCMCIVEAEVEAFMLWHHQRSLGPVIREVRQRAICLKEAELEEIWKKMKNIGSELTIKQKEIIEKFGHRMVGCLLHRPFSNLNELENPLEIEQASVWLERIFLQDPKGRLEKSSIKKTGENFS